MNITVYCSSSTQIADDYFRAAREVGRLLALKGCTVVSGGGREGLMAAVIEGCLDAGGRAVGYLPAFMMDRGWNHPRLTETHVVDTMRTRKQHLLEGSQGVIVLPGGIGTFEEMTEAMSLKKLDLWHGPVVLLDTLDYWRPFDLLMRSMYSRGFSDRSHGPLYTMASTPAQAVEAAIG